MREWFSSRKVVCVDVVTKTSSSGWWWWRRVVLETIWWWTLTEGWTGVCSWQQMVAVMEVEGDVDENGYGVKCTFSLSFYYLTLSYKFYRTEGWWWMISRASVSWGIKADDAGETDFGWWNDEDEQRSILMISTCIGVREASGWNQNWE